MDTKQQEKELAYLYRELEALERQRAALVRDILRMEEELKSHESER